MTIFLNIAQWVKSNIFHKSFLLGLCLSIGLFSPYIFGPDNLAEELAELFIYEKTGVSIDFTPESKEEAENVQKELFNKYKRRY